MPAPAGVQSGNLRLRFPDSQAWTATLSTAHLNFPFCPHYFLLFFFLISLLWIKGENIQRKAHM